MKKLNIALTTIAIAKIALATMSIALLCANIVVPFVCGPAEIPQSLGWSLVLFYYLMTLRRT